MIGFNMPNALKCMYVDPALQKFPGGDTPGPPVWVEGKGNGRGESSLRTKRGGEGLLPGCWGGWTPLDSESTLIFDLR